MNRGNPALDRLYAAICFDWDGTAVVDRRADASEIRSRVERLAALGVNVAVLSGTTVAKVDGQLRARPSAEGHLFLMLSRGSEIYVVGPHGPRLLDRLQASEEEERQLTTAAEGLRDRLAARGLEVGPIHDRLNRRKVDLIPEWTRPPSEAVDHLLEATDARLARAGLGGLNEAVDLARGQAHEAGLARARITTEGKHVEIGLTDKSDSMRWVLRHLVRERHRRPGELLVVGDQFGPVGELEGSDQRMLIPELHGATYVSVGLEPGGVPDGVLHEGGGPARLLAILDRQITRREKVARSGFPEPAADPAWLLAVEGYDPFREREVETWFTVANGETGTRGSLEEGSPASTPATFVAGVFGDGTSEPHIRQLTPAPDWLCLRLIVDGMHLNLANGEILEHRRVLDMSQGVVFRTWRQRDRTGRTVRVRTARFASLADRQLLAVRAEATAEDFSGRLVWESCLGVSHAGGPVLETSLESLDGAGFVARTKARRGGGHVLVASTAPAPGSPVARYLELAREVIGGRVEPGEPATIDRLAAVAASETRMPTVARAAQLLEKARREGYESLFERHREAWRARWADADVALEGDDVAQRALRFAVYHMIATAHPVRPDVSIGARGLSGQSYFGHVFWDTEVFVVPFFIYTDPGTARTLLTYRYRNLPGARRKAQRMGHKGALFPWESADTGDEATPPYGLGPSGEIVPILSGFLEHHISADVSWATWEYWMATGDDDFMVAMGAEMLLETARFWVSRATHDAEGHHHIPMVVGPDEYHESVDDNAYTNVLARWNICRALEIVDWLRERYPQAAAALKKRLGVTEKELRSWRQVADDMIDGFDPQTKLYEQFAGFFDLADVDPALLHPRPLPADLLLGREVTQSSKVVKQADVLMLCHLLPEEINDEVTRVNFDYYEPITVHGSSLSPGIHAAVAARLGLVEQAAESFAMAANVDLSDNMGNAARGLHMATMGALWQAAVMGFGGMRRRGTVLTIDPALPPGWSRLSFRARFRGARLTVTVEGARLEVSVDGAAVDVVLGHDAERTLAPGVHRYARTRAGTWKERR